ncbi:MAG: T9SS type A sorting domain-containing protein [Bacteroidia bacterium]|nr:T9SS type A sorting domain-containing protein [Bacteroidia bacterium]
MRKLFTTLTVLACAGLSAQTSFWTENFGSGCNRGTIVTSYTGSNGAWTLTNGTNQTYANQWFVSATAGGTAVNQCASSCLLTSNTNPTLHVGNPAVSIPNVINIGADTTSTYLTGLFCGMGICSTTDRRAESPTINCTNRTGISVTFLYYENGETTNDDATFWYYNGSSWAQQNALAKTTLGNCVPMGQWTTITINLPASANNNPNVKIGFRWVNNDDGLGNDPSFAVDDISVSGMSTIGMIQTDLSHVNVFAAGNEIYVENAGNFEVKGVYDLVGKEISFNRNGNILSVNAPLGIYFVELYTEGQRLVRKIMIR